MQDEKVKIYPGGLKAVNDLENVAVPRIITKMINAKLSSKRFGCEEDQQRAQQILKVLKTTPSNLEEYVSRLKFYNHLSYAYSEIESERNISVACFLESIGEEPPVYRVKVNKAFCEKNDVKAGLRVSFHPAGWTGKVLHAKVVKVDLSNGYIFAAPTDKRPRINLSQPYKVFVAPSSFNFRSRNRVLTTISAGNQQNIVFPQLPKNMLPVVEYVQQEAQDLSRMRFSPDKHLNELQKVAIIGIMRASPSLPYLLFGPPGTGKTITLVETIVQLLNASPAHKVLVCTPSNTAADLFALTLLKTGVVADTSILRMFSVSKPVNEQNADLDNVTWMVDDSDGFPIFGFEPKEEMQNKYRVIVSTLSASSYLVSGGLKGNFSHIIVDEAGQADELDTLIPIVGLADENTRVVLAGDPNQLGPVESIELLKPFELNTSLLERFIKSSCYGCDRRVMTMLKNNYRSHALLVETPSKLFYNGLLIASAMQSQKILYVGGAGSRPSVPLIFHSISDVEEVEKDGFSCRNLKEVELVVSYVKRILSETNVTPKEIGIISPYKYQVKTLRDQFTSLPEMVIDSVERFQGSERRVIIISTVRNMGLGFLDCDKRLNTTITRAQELMVIIGNHKNLSQSRSWKKMIEFCKIKKVLIGDLESPLQVVQKKFSKRDKNSHILIENDERMEIDDFDDSSLNNFNKPRSRGYNKSMQDSFEKSQNNTVNRAKKFPARGKELESIERSFDLMNLSAINMPQNEQAENDPSIPSAGSMAEDSVTSCCASDSFNRQFEEIMNSLGKL